MTGFSPRSWLKSWRPASRAARGRTCRTAARLNLESLEDRQLLATFLVTNANNAGAGSLRQAILSANSSSGMDRIEFRVGQGPKDLVPTSPLPEIIHPVFLDGTTQPGYAGRPLITIGGGSAGQFSEGLVLRANNSWIRSVTVRSFNGHGIVVSGNGNTIAGCWVGIDPFQTMGAGNRDAGVVLEGFSNRLLDNVISGNGGSGVVITGSRARTNFVGGGAGRNYIGTDRTGTVAVPNGQNGVWIGNGAISNVVGGGAWNVISGNNWAGVAIVGAGTLNNEVMQNFIGTNAEGRVALGNGAGVYVGQGASFNRIGMNRAGQGNVISGNWNEGVVLTDAGTSFNTVRGNSIGTTFNGIAAVPNQRDGVWIGNRARDNTVGGTTAGTGNVISGNAWSGVALFHTGTDGNTVHGNYIGTTAAGDAPLGNGAGVWIAQRARYNVIGGSIPAARNVISANHQQGVVLRDVDTSENVVQGNYIGTNAAGTAALGNADHGVWIDGADHNTVAGNLVSANGGAGVAVTGVNDPEDDRTRGNRVRGNTIGRDAAGTAPLGNLDGVYVSAGANETYVGGGAAGEGNLIASNRRHGVVLWDPRTFGNYVRGNHITANADSGVVVGNGASDNDIGDSRPGEANVITFNGTNGVVVPAGGRNQVRGNAISENGALGIDVDGDGLTFAHLVWLTGAATSGTDTTIEGWVIGAPNATYAVEFFSSAAADPSGFGEGEVPLNRFRFVTTDADGLGHVLATLPFTIQIGHCVSATAAQQDRTTWEFGNCLEVVASGGLLGAPGRDAARALGQTEAARFTVTALLPSHERAPAEGTALRADGAPLREHRPDGATVDAFFGGAPPLPTAAPPSGAAAVFPGEDGSLLWEHVFAFDAS